MSFTPKPGKLIHGISKNTTTGTDYCATFFTMEFFTDCVTFSEPKTGNTQLNNRLTNINLLLTKTIPALIKELDLMHNNDIAHRDLHGENILVDSNYMPKIIDLGSAKEKSSNPISFVEYLEHDKNSIANLFLLLSKKTNDTDLENLFFKYLTISSAEDNDPNKSLTHLKADYSNYLNQKGLTAQFTF
jgi:serine/threonine protein kinase